ncbi:MAG: glycoside hydrolase family 32 protein [Ruminococcaceae bacterium]|nr:glycoside hydrolase family 32 protein [Oscillospiraceae bacterium]
MKIEIKHKYLVFPVNTFCPQIQHRFFYEGDLFCRLNIKIDKENPSFTAYVDMSAYLGKVIDLELPEGAETVFEQADTMDLPNLYKEDYRPAVHFTTKNGWTNDPNGLIYLNGEYHMFFQHNPCEAKWNNMSWGHAVSRDLIHWNELDVAMWPDKYGEMFSGCAFIDEHNLTGLQEGDEPPVLLYYTATNPIIQRLAYSTDGLKTIKKHDKPMVPLITDGNRDPAVVYCEDIGCYIMALYLEQDIFGILTSSDLMNWELLQRFHFPGDYECPDIFTMYTKEGERKWVIMGARNRYMVGEMTKEGFVPSQEAMSLGYSGTNYAGHSFYNMPGDRRVRIDWDRWNIPTLKLNGQMSVPNELTLEKHGDIYYLCSNPIAEFESLYDSTRVFANIKLTKDSGYEIAAKPGAYLMKMSCEPTDAIIEMNVFGSVFTFDFKENVVKFAGERTIPMTVLSDKLDLTLIVDRFSAELYLDGGKAITGIVDPAVSINYDLSKIILSADSDAVIDKLRITSLKSIWE